MGHQQGVYGPWKWARVRIEERHGTRSHNIGRRQKHGDEIGGMWIGADLQQQGERRIQSGQMGGNGLVYMVHQRVRRQVFAGNVQFNGGRRRRRQKQGSVWIEPRHFHELVGTSNGRRGDKGTPPKQSPVRRTRKDVQISTLSQISATRTI